MEKQLVITDSNYEGYSELFNAREEACRKKRIKNMKIYAGIFCVSAGIGIVVAMNSNPQAGLVSSLFIGGWGTIIKQKIEDLRGDSIRLDCDTFQEIKENYPNIDPYVNQDLLYLALAEQEMLKQCNDSNVYAVAENFKGEKNHSQILCKECLK